jgi:hypothetical protein
LLLLKASGIIVGLISVVIKFWVVISGATTTGPVNEEDPEVSGDSGDGGLAIEGRVHPARAVSRHADPTRASKHVYISLLLVITLT